MRVVLWQITNVHPHVLRGGGGDGCFSSLESDVKGLREQLVFQGGGHKPARESTGKNT